MGLGLPGEQVAAAAPIAFIAQSGSQNGVPVAVFRHSAGSGWQEREAGRVSEGVRGYVREQLYCRNVLPKTIRDRQPEHPVCTQT